ncbi:MAG: DUF4190 domain-containing protein [Clostridia bacterium]|nr:DUF4190 domain-containing protein [Clostridia bacterium]
MFCKHCGKEVNENAIICPECGVPTDNYAAVATPSKTTDNKFNGFALAGMICAIVGIIGGNWIWCIPSIVGLIFSIIGFVKVKEFKSGYGFALAGIIVGALGLLIWLIIWGAIAWASWINFIYYF